MNFLFALLICSGISLCLAAEPDGIRHFRFSGFEILCLQDRATRMPSALFHNTDPDDPRKFKLPKDWEASVNVFLIRKDSLQILVDAGNPPDKGSLISKLALLGCDPGSIQAVLITHIHPDHVGGLVDKQGKSLFPNAVIHLPRQEYDSWLAGQEPGRLSQVPWLNACRKQIRFFDDQETIVAGIQVLAAAGHTPGHSLFRLADMLFIGDLIHAAAMQIANPAFCARYDADPGRAVKSRVEYLSVAAEKKLQVWGAHLPFPGTGFIEPGAPGAQKNPSFRYRPAD